jgi:hypothetical protein
LAAFRTWADLCVEVGVKFEDDDVAKLKVELRQKSTAELIEMATGRRALPGPALREKEIQPLTKEQAQLAERMLKELPENPNGNMNSNGAG